MILPMPLWRLIPKQYKEPVEHANTAATVAFYFCCTCDCICILISTFTIFLLIKRKLFRDLPWKVKLTLLGMLSYAIISFVLKIDNIIGNNMWYTIPFTDWG